MPRKVSRRFAAPLFAPPLPRPQRHRQNAHPSLAGSVAGQCGACCRSNGMPRAADNSCTIRFRGCSVDWRTTSAKVPVQPAELAAGNACASCNWIHGNGYWRNTSADSSALVAWSSERSRSRISIALWMRECFSASLSAESWFQVVASSLVMAATYHYEIGPSAIPSANIDARSQYAHQKHDREISSHLFKRSRKNGIVA